MIRTNQTHKNYQGTKPVMAEENTSNWRIEVERSLLIMRLRSEFSSLSFWIRVSRAWNLGRVSVFSESSFFREWARILFSFLRRVFSELISMSSVDKVSHLEYQSFELLDLSRFGLVGGGEGSVRPKLLEKF